MRRIFSGGRFSDFQTASFDPISRRRSHQYNYGGGSSADNALNRLHSLRRDGTTLADYRYLGQERAVIADYSGEPGVKLTYFASGQSVEAGDPCVGLDRGARPVLAGSRMIDQRWRRTGDANDLDGVKCDGACPGGAGNAA